MPAIKIIVGGDLCPVNRFEALFRGGERAAILGDFSSLFEQADLVVANLECPLIEQFTPISKTGPILGASAECIKGIASMGINALGLANNHIMDHGIAGLTSTISASSGRGISTFGAGRDIDEARKIQVFPVNGIRIALMGMAEHEWSIAKQRTAGANPLDIMHFVRQMRNKAIEYDYLIVLLHAGIEGYPFPSPRLRDVCRFLVEEGANLVICQHSHCTGCCETYKGQHILYGQGNFIFDYNAHGESGQEGVLVSLKIDADRKATFNIVPFVQGGIEVGLRRMSEDKEAAFLASFHERSRLLGVSSSIEEHWQALCSNRRYSYISEIAGHGRILRRLNRKGAITRLNGKRFLKNMLSVVQNESHLEVLLTSVGQLLRDHDQ